MKNKEELLEVLRTMEVKNLEQLEEYERLLEEYKNSIDLEDKSNGE